MCIQEFLEADEIQLPIRRTSEDFEGFVNCVLNRYLHRITALTAPAENQNDVLNQIRNHIQLTTNLCNHLKIVVSHALRGRPNVAYSEFVAGITPLTDLLNEQSASDVDIEGPGNLYRVRTSARARLTREDIFHIPFDQQHRVATQRYSIPGLPCLYLSGSVYVCWAEMGSPPFHELQASAFWLSRKIKILNFSNRPLRLNRFHIRKLSSSFDSGDINLIARHIILWPLIAMCSIIVLYPESPFKPAYIIPQLVLQWITQDRQDFDGICYFSTHVEGVTNYPIQTCNLVFPSREITSVGRCAQLRSLFKLTSPHSWDLLRGTNPGENIVGLDPNFDFEFLDGISEHYALTDFGKVEYNLNKLAYAIKLRNSHGEPELGNVRE